MCCDLLYTVLRLQYAVGAFDVIKQPKNKYWDMKSFHEREKEKAMHSYWAQTRNNFPNPTKR